MVSQMLLPGPIKTVVIQIYSSLQSEIWFSQVSHKLPVQHLSLRETSPWACRDAEAHGATWGIKEKGKTAQGPAVREVVTGNIDALTRGANLSLV